MYRTICFTLIVAFVLTDSSCGGSGMAPVASTSSVTTSSSAPASGATVASVSPASAAAGSSDVTVTIAGTNFIADANHRSTWAVWTVAGNDTALQTTFVSTTQLTAIVPASLLAKPVTAKISVQIGDSMAASDGVMYAKSNAVTFDVQ